MTRRSVQFWAPVAFGLVLLGLWALTVHAAGLEPYVLPHPLDVLHRLGDDAGQRDFWHATGVTLFEALGGTLLGAAVATPLAIAIHSSALVSAALNPFLGASQAVPAVALAPLLVLWVDYGTGAIMVLCALMVFFPMLVQATVGLRLVDPEVVDAARLDGASRVRILRHIEAPLAAPTALAGLRTGFTLSVTGAVVGEMVMGGTGLGQVLTVERDGLDTTGMFATIIVLCTLSALAYTLIRTLENRARRATTLARET